MRDPADDGPEIRTIRREEVVSFVEWVDFNVGEVKCARSSNSRVSLTGWRRFGVWLELLWNAEWL